MSYVGQHECGAIRIEAEASRRAVTICYCKQCLRLAGYAWASVPVAGSTVTGKDHLNWYQSSDCAPGVLQELQGAPVFLSPRQAPYGVDSGLSASAERFENQEAHFRGGQG